MTSPAAAYRALVVDDDVLVRTATGRALGQEGFVCELAADGRQALERIQERSFDLVVTDLLMPDVHGHKVVVELLAMSPRPAIVVLTGMGEPKLVKDLLARGVDDVFYKPAHYEVLVLKARALIQRRQSQAANEAADNGSLSAEVRSEVIRDSTGDNQTTSTRAAAASEAPLAPRVAWAIKDAKDAAELARDVSQIRKSLPEPPPTYDGFREASSDQFRLDELATAVQMHPGAANEVLLFANTVIFQASQEIDGLGHAQPAAFRTGATSFHWFHAALLAGTFIAGLLAGSLPWLLRRG